LKLITIDMKGLIVVCASNTFQFGFFCHLSAIVSKAIYVLIGILCQLA